MNYGGVSEAYDAFLTTGTNDAERVGWKDKEYQDQLFRILLDGIAQREPSSGGFTVLDAGCGLGSFSEALRTRFPKAIYTGMDLNGRSLLLAREKYSDQEFLHCDINEPPLNRQWDYVVACGLFNIFYGLSEAQHVQHVHSSLAAMWSIAKQGIVWNHITDFNNDFKKSGVYYARPWTVHEWALKNLSPYVSIRQDYYRWAFSAYAYKTAAAATPE